MRTGLAAGGWIIATTVLTTGFQPGPARDALARLEAARASLGGSQQIADIQTLTLRGTFRIRNQLFGKVQGATSQFVSQRFETNILLPDHCVERKDLGASITYEGFAGDTLLNRGVRADGRPVAGYFPPDMINTERANCGYLLLALFLRTTSAFPFVFKDATADTLLFTSPKGVDVRIDLDPGTNVPLRLRYDASSGSGGKVPTVIELSHNRPAGDLIVPHRLTMRRQGVLESEREFSAIEINPPLTPGDFRK